MSSGACGGARAEGNHGQVLVAGERTIQSVYDRVENAVRRYDPRSSSVRRRPATFTREALSPAAYMTALDATSDGVVLLNRAGLVVYANRAAEEFFSNVGLSGVFFADVVSLERRKLTAIWRELHRARWWHGQLSFGGHRPDLEVTVQRVCEEGVRDHFCAVLHGAGRPMGANVSQPQLPDSEDPRSMRNAMNELQAALQRVASEIAHDFNNQIAVILNYTFVLLRQMPADSPLKAHVSEMQAAAWRASQIAQAIHRALVTHTAHTLLAPHSNK
jgi:PAS domain-containing protein